MYYNSSKLFALKLFHKVYSEREKEFNSMVLCNHFAIGIDFKQSNACQKGMLKNHVTI